MKNIYSIAGILALAVSSLSASPLPENAKLLASNTVVAQYMGLMELPCRGMTADCPDKCGHGTKVARFRVVRNEAYSKSGKYGDDKIEPASILMVDVKNPTPGQDDAALGAFVSTLTQGDKVRLTQAHYYGLVGSAMTPFRPVTKVEKLDSAPAVPATPAAAPGDYSVAPISRVPKLR
jgi:hypothetical protein